MSRLWQECRAWIKHLSALQRAGLVLGLLLAGIWLVQRAPTSWLLGLGGDSTWERITRESMVHVGMDASYPPFETVDEAGAFYGLDVDLAQNLGLRWGVQVVLVNIHFDGLYDALASKRCDMIISALPYDRMLTRDVLYSQSYFDAGHVVLTRSSSNIIAVDDLEKHVVAVELGAEAHHLAKLLVRDLGLDLDILALREAEQVLAALTEGRAEALICDKVTAFAYRREAPDLIVLDPPLSTEPLVIAVPIDASRLLAETNAALTEWQTDGTVEAWQARWFQ